jgi:hypothetical protein
MKREIGIRTEGQAAAGKYKPPQDFFKAVLDILLCFTLVRVVPLSFFCDVYSFFAHGCWLRGEKFFF